MKIYTETLREERNLFIGILVVLFSLLLLVVAIYPGDEKAIEIIATIQEMEIYKLFIQAEYGESGAYRFWLALEVFSYIFLIPVFLSAMSGTAIFASEQDNNRLDILLSMPFTRQRIFIEKWLAMATTAIIVTLSGFIVILFSSLLLRQSVPIDFLFLAWILMIPLLLFVGTLGGLFGITFLERFKARLALLTFVGISFFSILIFNVNEEMHQLSFLSIFHYYNGSGIILETNLQNIAWMDFGILICLTALIFIYILWKLQSIDLIPHYDQEAPPKEGKVRGVPRLFFYTARFRNKLPIFLEQIQADRLILNLYLVFILIVGLTAPMSYPGDEEMAKIVSSVGGNIMYDAMLQGRPVPANIAGYMITQGYAALWLHMGLFAVIMGPRLFTRDINGQTIDMLMGNPLKRQRLFIERILAISLEFLTIFVFVIIGSIIGQLAYGETTHLLYTTILFGIAVLLYWFWAMMGLMIGTFIKHPRLAIAGFAGVYFLFLTPYLLSGVSEALEPIAQLTPFYWYDPYAILIDQTIDLVTLGSGLIFLLGGIFFIFIMLKQLKHRDIVETYESKT
ncbi:MAG: ABC transporter permease subunit [Candidatus Hodarchaeales archaeon]